MAKADKLTARSEPTNGGKATIDASQPYRVLVKLRGSCDLMFHRWNSEAVEAKAKAAKNSAAKKTDDTESYLWRDKDGMICIPTEYVRQSIIWAAKFKQDPRSPRKSAADLYKAGIQPLTNLASLGKDAPDYFDQRRVVVQRSGVNRTRPCIREGWEAEFVLLVITPEYINQSDLHGVLTQAGRLIGIGDFRPTFGRFDVASLEVLEG